MATGTLFKAGLLVEDLERAMRDVGAWLGLEWTPVQQSSLVLETRAGRESVELRYAYSTRGPMYLELLESQPSGYYAMPEGPRLHHVGRWVDDLAQASETLASAGLPREAVGVDANGQAPAMFAFHAAAGGGSGDTDHGVRVELVDRAMQPTFESWLAGGRLDLA